MKKINLLLVFMLTVIFVKAQEKFELGVSLNSGLYFPEEKELGYNIDKGLQTGIGLNANYFVTKTTKLGIGVIYNYVKTFETSYYSPEPIIPVLHTVEIPFYVRQYFNKKWFADGGASASFHPDEVATLDGKIGVFGRWNLGAGIKFNKLAISVNYAQNFKNRTIIVESVNSGSVYFTDYKRKILSVKVEYSIWSF